MLIRVLILDSSWARSFFKALSCTIYQVISVRSINKRMFKHPIRFQMPLKMTSNDLKMTYFQIKICSFPIMYQNFRKISQKFFNLEPKKVSLAIITFFFVTRSNRHDHLEPVIPRPPTHHPPRASDASNITITRSPALV